MNNFIFRNPTKLIFGRGQVEQLRNEIPRYGTNVLLVYGGGSIKKNGVYDAVMNELNAIGADVIELAGVEPNPRLSTVRRGVDICRSENRDFLLAVGGGSVIDCTKAIAAGAKFDGDPWEFISRKKPPQAALPFGTVLTLAATGSEMNAGAVITNWETNEKTSWSSPHTYPQFSILDPANTVTVPRHQTVYGIVDMMSHVMEQYFHHVENTPLQDRMCEATLETIIEAAPRLLEDLEDLSARETIMYCGTIALNGMLSMGARGDWATHNIEHAVSAVYDIPHAGGLAILYPNWMEHCLQEGRAKYKQLAVRVFGVNPEGKNDDTVARQGIELLRAFWLSLGAPSRLADYDIGEDKIDVMAEKAMAFGPFGVVKKLHKEDVAAILRAAL